MSYDARRLYELLPAVYRDRDARRGQPLAALLAVVAEQVAVLEENLEQLYDDQFIETCAPWVVPYIGDLIGHRPLDRGAADPVSGRAEVAHTIAFRRRKGTAAMLEQLARDITGRAARAVEFFALLATTQHVNHVRPRHAYAPDLREWEPLERLATPFETTAHTADVRRIASGAGRYGIPNIGIFVWRLGAYSLTSSPAVDAGPRRFRCSPLGHDAPLFTRPEPEDEVTHLADPLNVPLPISRRVLDRYLRHYCGLDDRGRARSIVVWRDGQAVDPDEIEVCDLSDAGGDWAHTPADKVALDPVLGRLAFPADVADVRVSVHYGFGGDVGGGEYERNVPAADEHAVWREVAAPASIQASLDLVTGGGIVEIADSGRYAESLTIRVDADAQVTLRAADRVRPTVVLDGDLVIRGGPGSEVTLDGLLITRGAIGVPADAGNALARLRLRHCTLVPGIELAPNGDPAHPDRPSLVIDLPAVTVEIERCIVGGLRVDAATAAGAVRVTDSVVDATAETAVAYAAPDGAGPGAPLTIVNSTVIGKVHALRIDDATNVIFLADVEAGDGWPSAVRVDRRQQGCVRFSFVPLEAQLPRRYRCQPATAEDAVRVRPRLASPRYGQADYAVLQPSGPIEIRRGAHDEGEMGVFHHLAEPHREAALRLRLDEYLRIGLEAGIVHVLDDGTRSER